MNIAFSKILKTPTYQLEFNFRKLNGNHPGFYADVTDERGRRIVFSLFKNEQDHWMVQGQDVPLWISSMETRLGQAIDEELKNEIWSA